jgi:hypothetical protein
LKRLNPDKEIQGKQSLFLGKIWVGLGAAWPDFAGFGENFADLDRRAMARLGRIRLPNRP